MPRQNYKMVDICMKCKHHLSVYEIKGLKFDHWPYAGTVCDMEKKLQELHDRINLDGKEPFDKYAYENNVSFFGTCDCFEKEEMTDENNKPE